MSRRKVEINRKHASYEDLKKLYRETDDAQLKIRYLAMMNFMEGKTSLAVAERLRTSDSTVREWLKRYNTFGPDGLMPQKPLKIWIEKKCGVSYAVSGLKASWRLSGRLPSTL